MSYQTDHRQKFVRKGAARIVRQALDPRADDLAKLAALLVTCGDKPIMAAKMTGDMAAVVVRDFDRFRDEILTTFAGCTAELAHKPHAYAALLAAIAARSPAIASTLLEGVISHLTAAVDADRSSHLRSMVRFLACSAELGVVSAASLLASVLAPLSEPLVLQQQQHNGSNSDAASNGDNRRDAYATAVLSALLFAPAALASVPAPEFAAHHALPSALLALTAVTLAYAEQRASDPHRSALRSAVAPLDPAFSPFAQDDWLLTYARSVAAVIEAGTAVPLAAWAARHFDMRGATLAAAIPEFDAAAWVPIEINASLPLAVMEPESRARMSHFDAPPLVTYRVFVEGMDHIAGYPEGHKFGVPGSFVPHVPTAGAPERLVAESVLADLLVTIQHNHKEGVRYLLDAKLMFATGTWDIDADEALNLAPPEEMGVHPSVPKFNFEQIVVEQVFTALFRLPAPQVRPVFYTDVIMGLCRMSAKRIAQAFAKAVHVTFGRLEYADRELIVRLVDLFSHHLSNFSFGWRWSDWAFVVASPADPSTAARRAFVTGVLEHIVRLAYHGRIVQLVTDPAYVSLLEQLRPITPADPTADALARDDPTARIHGPLYAKVSALIRAKASADEVSGSVTALLADDTASVAAAFADSPAARAQALLALATRAQHAVVRAVLAHGAATFSHSMTVLSMYHSALRKVTSAASAAPGSAAAAAAGMTRDAKIGVVAEAWHFWQHNRQFFVIVLDKLLFYRVVEPGHVVAWVAAELTKGPLDGVAAPAGAASGEGNDDMAVDGDAAPPVVAAPLSPASDPLFVMEVLAVTVKKALFRVDALEARVSSANAMDAPADEAQLKMLQTNLSNAVREKVALFTQIAEMLLGGVNQDAAQGGSQWSSWTMGTLMSMLRSVYAP
ncbi:MIF4G like-domain-containing protein [Blastocladiella britannica]|nr:MIF4G like-domain-containing protein [Blastocladiella britannica]